MGSGPTSGNGHDVVEIILEWHVSNLDVKASHITLTSDDLENQRNKMKKIIITRHLNLCFSLYLTTENGSNNAHTIVLTVGGLKVADNFECKFSCSHLNPNKILILGKVGFQSDQITAASWSGNTCQPSNQLIITLIRLLFGPYFEKTLGWSWWNIFWVFNMW